ncbi:PTS system mannose/fructose/sorbose family transporter subunit IID [Caproiciproducens sp.]
MPENQTAELQENNLNKKVTHKDLIRVFWRSFLIECSYNSERMHNLGYIFSLTPILKRIYKDDREGMAGALQRHVEFYNATPQIEPTIIGIVGALEEQNAQSGNQMGDMVSAIKTSLMGPMSVIGDTLFFTSGFRVLSVSVGAAMCAAGNPLGLLLYFLIFNVPHYLASYWGVTQGYKLGSNFIETIVESGWMEKVREVAFMVGLTVIGALTSSYVSLSTPISFTYGQSTIALQDILDQIVLKGLPLAATLLCSWLMRKKNVKAQVLIIIVMVVGILGGIVGIFS